MNGRKADACGPAKVTLDDSIMKKPSNDLMTEKAASAKYQHGDLELYDYSRTLPRKRATAPRCKMSGWKPSRPPTNV